MKVKNYDELKQGDWYFTDENPQTGERRLSFLCPCGCGMLAGIRVNSSGTQDGYCWVWNKSEDSPTTTPSININEGHWHGYLTDGVFRN